MHIFIRDVTLRGKFGSTGYGGKAAHFPHGKASLFSERVPPLCPGGTWVTLQIPSCPSASCPFTHHHSDKTPVQRRCGTDCSVILSEIKSNVAKAVFVGISKGPYWCELPSISRVSVSEIFYAPMKIAASMLRFCFCIDCCLATWEMVWDCHACTDKNVPQGMDPSDLGFWIDRLKLRSWTAGFTGAKETAPRNRSPPRYKRKSTQMWVFWLFLKHLILSLLEVGYWIRENAVFSSSIVFLFP